MLYWEWRRILRQKIRNRVPRTTLTYQQFSNRRLIITFVMFFIGWKAFGVTLSDMLLWTVDEETGEGRLLTPEEGRKRRELLERERDRSISAKAQTPLPKFDFDD